jgi:hypothetical protein
VGHADRRGFGLRTLQHACKIERVYKLDRLSFAPGDTVKLKKSMAAAAIAAAFGITALGLGSGAANAVPTSPVAAGTPWSQDGGHGHGHGHDDWDGGDGWGGPWYGPAYWGPGISACVNASGPWGYVSGSLCI